MKAFLLAAGRGTRLRPLTDSVPKCMVPVKGVPLLGIWLKLLGMHGITDALVNLHHFPHMVEDYINDSHLGVNVTTFYEEALLGSAGTVLANRDFVRGEKAFFIIYADNLTNVDLERMAEFHLSHGGCFTMALFRTEEPRSCGIAELDEDNIITSFIEKPAEPATDLANAGIYIANEELFDFIPSKEHIDFGFDVLPGLVNRMRGYVIEEYLIDIGNPENYKNANEEWVGL
jgi:mannose-1-phosphate guanylyltransferase